jgi:hypothetical protein
MSHATPAARPFFSLFFFGIAGLDPAIHAASGAAWTTGSSPVVTRKRKSE